MTREELITSDEYTTTNIECIVVSRKPILKMRAELNRCFINLKNELIGLSATPSKEVQLSEDDIPDELLHIASKRFQDKALRFVFIEGYREGIKLRVIEPDTDWSINEAQPKGVVYTEEDIKKLAEKYFPVVDEYEDGKLIKKDAFEKQRGGFIIGYSLAAQPIDTPTTICLNCGESEPTGLSWEGYCDKCALRKNRMMQD